VCGYGRLFAGVPVTAAVAGAAVAAAAVVAVAAAVGGWAIVGATVAVGVGLAQADSKLAAVKSAAMRRRMDIAFLLLGGLITGFTIGNCRSAVTLQKEGI
jgi:hypothetical protein